MAEPENGTAGTTAAPTAPTAPVEGQAATPIEGQPAPTDGQTAVSEAWNGEGQAPETNTANILAGLRAEMDKEIAATKAVRAQLDESHKEQSTFDQRFGALANKEKELRTNQPDSKEIEANIRAQVEKELMADPIKYLASKGMNFETLTELQVNEGKNAERFVESKMAEMKAEYDSKIKAIEDSYANDKKTAAENKHEQTVSNFKANLSDFIDEGGSEYELIQKSDSYDMVYNLIEKHYNETQVLDHEGKVVKDGRIMTEKEAADYVEQYLMEQVSNLAKLEKLGFKPSEVQTTEPTTQSTDTSQTLSNAHSALGPDKGDFQLSREQSIKKAASLLKWD